MKSAFSTKWKASKQPRKQRKYIYNAPNHLRTKFMSATLSKELRKKYGMRSIGLKKGDEVVVMKGKFKKKTGKIVTVDRTNTRVSIENLQKTKNEGTKVNVWFHPSNLMIKVLNTDDGKRFKRKSMKVDESKPKKSEEKKASKETKPTEKKNAPKKN
jgi:large subunit ribosomal protein L24